MLSTDTNRQQLILEVEMLHRRLAEFEKIDDELRREKAALQRAEEKLRIIVENTHDIIFQLSSLGVIRYVSPKVKEIYGYETSDLIGKHFKKTTPMSEVPKAIKVLKSALSGRTISNFELNQFSANGKIVIMEINIAPVRKDGKIIAVEGVMRDITERKRADEEAKRNTEKLLKAMEDTIASIAMIIEMRDPYTAGHQRRVAQLACFIAREMDIPEDEIKGLRLAGLVHDIGKVRVPTEILTNPNRLTEAEFSLIKMHPTLGYEILEKMDFPWPIAKIVHQHHERINGSGYPSGLSGEEIILEAKILAVADVVEAMASHRPYRLAQGLDKALEEIAQQKGILYEPAVVDACLKLFEEKQFKLE